MDRLRRWAVPVWATLLALLMLGPALAPGYVLSYDMVWVPDLALRPDFLGVGSALPRAVPSDAVVAVLDEVLPGMLLQKVVLLGALVGAGVGAARLVDGSLVGRLVACSLAIWNPFVVERLVIGHWPVLLGYAGLPWIAHAARTWRTTGHAPTRLWWLVVVASLSASAGVATAAVLVCFAAKQELRRLVAIAAMILAANAPWLVAGLLHLGDAATSAAGAAAFALQDEGSVPGPVAALTFGGIWNSEVVPASRTGPPGWLWLLLVLTLVVLGQRAWRTAAGRRDVIAFLVCWVLGWGLGVFTWLLPDAVGWLVVHVPGAGLFRDGARLLSLCAFAVAPVAGHGAAAVVRQLTRAARPGFILAVLLAPLALMPDAAFGASGRLGAVDYPEHYAETRRVVARAADQGAVGDVLILPLTSYRQPDWNDNRKVLDPMGRYLTIDYVAGDDLFVSGVRIVGEDHRVRAVAVALDRGDPDEVPTALARMGIGLVVSELDAGPVPTVQAASLLRDTAVLVQELPAPQERVVPASSLVAVVCAWSLFSLAPLVAVLGAAWRRRTRVVASAPN